jgi:pseudaminic acid synthase
MALDIGPVRAGEGHRPVVIAEMSANHRGSFEAAMRIVEAAAAHGADAIKLQTYTAATLTIDSARPEFFIDDRASLWHGRRLWDLYQEAHTPWDWHRPIFESARARGLACISTAYDLTSLEFLLEIGVDAVKIASFELVHLPLLAAAARSGKPLLVSTGMATLDEISAAVETVRAHGCNRLMLLKCTSAYPADEADANLLTIPDMRRRFHCEVGVSDHTLGPYAAFAATALGAAAIEKHVTLARSEGGVDASFSVEPHELRELAVGTDLVWRSCGEVHYAPLPSERASRAERPSIYVVAAVTRGERFNATNIRVIRPSAGLAPARYAEVLGRVCAIDCPAGTPLSWSMIAPE